jgi:hypothetical protein
MCPVIPSLQIISKKAKVGFNKSLTAEKKIPSQEDRTFELGSLLLS